MDRKAVLRGAVAGSANIRFRDFIGVVGAFGFRLLRVKGSHHILSRSGVAELVNLQEVEGKVKPYQIRQFLRLVERYGLSMEDER